MTAGKAAYDGFFLLPLRRTPVPRGALLPPLRPSVPPAGAFGWRPELKPAQDIVRLNGMIRAYADAEGIPYVDYHTPMAAADGSMNADYTKDGVHPTEAGYAVMERILPPVVKRVQAEIGK